MSNNNDSNAGTIRIPVAYERLAVIDEHIDGMLEGVYAPVKDLKNEDLLIKEIGTYDLKPIDDSFCEVLNGVDAAANPMQAAMAVKELLNEHRIRRDCHITRMTRDQLIYGGIETLWRRSKSLKKYIQKNQV